MTEGPERGEQPWRVAVVGSGPSGMYAAASLLAADPSVEVDIFDRLPAPYGLVRYGVAPDHQKIKNVSRVFDRTLLDERVRLLGNVEVGRDVSHQELKSAYHQIVYAVGAQGDRRLAIEGEDLDGSWSSTEFVNWYNGHPDRAEDDYSFDDCSEVAVIGIGNVAMDVARILVSPPDLLAKTDIADSALETLRRSPVKTVHLLARRGPVQAKCSPPELKELGELEGVTVRVDPRDLDLDPVSEAALEDDKSAVKNLAILRGFSDDAMEGGYGGEGREVRLHFCTSPTALIGGEEGAVVGLRFSRNELVPGEGGYVGTRASGEGGVLSVGRVIRAIGYRSEPLLELPYDSRRGVVPNREGRIFDGEDALVGEYVVGWVKRGPSGLIGSNKLDAKETVEHMLADRAQGETLEPTRNGVDDLLRTRGVRAVSYADWLRIDAAEVERGERDGRPRNKFVRVAEMLDALLD